MSASPDQVYLRATHEATLKHCELADLKSHALDLAEAEEDLKSLDAMRAQLTASVSFKDPENIRPEEKL